MGARTLYDCLYAKVEGDRIRCSEGQRLSNRKDGTVGIMRLAKGSRLTMHICQQCDAFESMGPPVPSEERGWLPKKERWET